MADVEHSSLTDPDIHEPKGITTALDGEVYIADGSNSGDWGYLPSGWGYYKDDAAAQTFNTTAAKLSIDGLGSTTEESYLPRGIRGSSNLWNTADDKVTPVALGDAYTLRIDLPVTGETGSPNTVTIELDVGGGSSPSDILVSEVFDVPSSSTVSFTFPVFCLADFVSNGCQIFLTTDTGTVDITAPAILITRTHGEV